MKHYEWFINLEFVFDTLILAIFTCKSPFKIYNRFCSITHCPSQLIHQISIYYTTKIIVSHSYHLLYKILNKFNPESFKPHSCDILLLITLNSIWSKHTSDCFIWFYIHFIVHLCFVFCTCCRFCLRFLFLFLFGVFWWRYLGLLNLLNYEFALYA